MDPPTSNSWRELRTHANDHNCWCRTMRQPRVRAEMDSRAVPDYDISFSAQCRCQKVTSKNIWGIIKQKNYVCVIMLVLLKPVFFIDFFFYQHQLRSCYFLFCLVPQASTLRPKSWWPRRTTLRSVSRQTTVLPTKPAGVLESKLSGFLTNMHYISVS